MAKKISVAQGHDDLLRMIHRFVSGQGEHGVSSYTGTGNGTIGDVNVGDDINEETWTITCSDYTTAGAEIWTVSGSVSGAQDNAITGVDYDIGKLSFLITAGGTDFVNGDQFTVDQANYTGTGDGTIGTIEKPPAAVDETWTITVTSTAGGAGNETWSVVGSVSGTLATATTGVAYANAFISFLITAGAVKFAVNDAFDFDVSEGEMTTLGRAWVVDKFIDGSALYLRGVGLDGTKEIFVGIRAYENVGSDYYNFAVMGATGFVDANSFANQPGTSGERYVPLWDQEIPFRLYVNGQRIMLTAQIETVFVSFYLGFIFPYATPGQFPYPIVVGGTDAASTDRYSVTTRNTFFKMNVTKIRATDGIWTTCNTFPDGTNFDAAGNEFDEGLGNRDIQTTGADGYVLLPLVLLVHNVNTYGEMDGVAWVTGFSNAVGNTLTDSVTSKEYYMTRNFHRTGFWEYAAMEDA